MPTRHGEPAIAEFPSPFPEGWYFIATRRDVERAGLLQRTWMGENIVVWSDDDGRVCVAEAVCPHLGSDLGPDAGGRVCAGRLVCSFHGFEFDATGQCVDTPYAAPPRSARLRVFEAREIAGLIFAWWGIEGREPQWRLPEAEPEQAGWSKIAVHTIRFPGHPQETTENVVDIAHLRYVHGYGAVERIEPVTVDGPLLLSSWNFESVRKVAGFAKLVFDLTARTSIYGLGYSYVDVREHSIGLDLRLWVLATPVDGTLIDMSLATQVREIRHPKRRIAGLGFLPVKLRAPIMNRFMARQQVHDVEQDVVIWSRKRYVSPPRLNRSDGEVTMFRAYCAQFYADPGPPPEPSTPEAAGVAQGASA